MAHDFHPVISRWFSDTLGAPTDVQNEGWAAIDAGRHTLISAPTGSGKTLAAFLHAIDQLFREGLEQPLRDEVRVIYVSPLKALSADIHKNLAEPRSGICAIAAEMGLDAPRITAAVRTGDTPSSERAAMLRTPPHILVTTPESLYLLLTAERSRSMLRTARLVIVDEIHALIGTRRGAHLALTLERLAHVAEQPLQRVGLSATQKPIEEVARYLAGNDGTGDHVTIIDRGHRRAIDLGLELPRSPLDAVMSHEVWTEYYDRLTERITAHRTTLIFVNTRKMAERIARHLTERLGESVVAAHHGSLSKENRLDAESRLKAGTLRALVATASLELGIDIGAVDLVCQIGSPRRIATFLQRVGRSGHSISGTPKGRLFPLSLDDLVECAALLRSVKQGELDAIVAHDHPLDVLAQQIVAETACEEHGEDDLFALMTRAWPYRALERKDFDAVVQMVAEGFATPRGRRAALVHRDEVNSRLRGRRVARMLSITSGGAIPEVADYRVVLEPEETFVGTLNEDFAIESNAGDIFQLGNTSWQILQVASGTVRVRDAKGAPPTIPFWTGEAPARSDELSRAVSDLRSDVERWLGLAAELEPETGRAQVAGQLASGYGIDLDASREIVAYLADARNILGALPTQNRLILERFFDESGGMQLVLHAPLGARINKAWGLALRKRFCRQFNFELQAAATDDAVLLSLGPQHSFPLADVFRYLHPATARDVLVQAFLDAPVFQTRWRWNSTISLAVPRNRNGRKIPPPLQRAMAGDLMAAVFPDAAACFENIRGDRELPDHPLVNQAIRDCLEEAMDFEGLSAVLSRIHANEIQLVARDTPEPSVLSHDILNAKPYAFLDDAPLEERRTQAVMTRRAGEQTSELAALDAAAIERVRDESRPDPRDADELHDVLLTAGFLTDEEVRSIDPELFAALARHRRATRLAEATGAQSEVEERIAIALSADRAVWVAAERLPELLALHPQAHANPPVDVPPLRAARSWTAEDAIVELLRGRMSILGPTTADDIARSLSVPRPAVDTALLALEASGAILRGSFTSRAGTVEWCDRRLLARIHRYTISRLRAEIEPVSPSDFMRFLFAWQHAVAATRLTGIDGLRRVVRMLDGFELAASSWERSVLPARIAGYEPSMLDLLCFTGEGGWSRLSRPTAAPSVIGATPMALVAAEHRPFWNALRQWETSDEPDVAVEGTSQAILETLRSRGALFARDLAQFCGASEEAVYSALADLASRGLVTSDGFEGLRSLIRTSAERKKSRADMAGRWSVAAVSEEVARGDALEAAAWTLLRRYGVIFRRLLTREAIAPPWRDLLRVYRRLEARGEIRGGRFVSGMSGEQFALIEGVERLREVRRDRNIQEHLVVISGADPLNLTGIVTAGERIRATASVRIAYLDGVPLSVIEGDYLRPLSADATPDVALEAAAALAGRRVPVSVGYVGRPVARFA